MNSNSAITPATYHPGCRRRCERCNGAVFVYSISYTPAETILCEPCTRIAQGRPTCRMCCRPIEQQPTGWAHIGRAYKHQATPII